jgi:glycosyltransferase involved in cell wall biosynthesis
MKILIDARLYGLENAGLGRYLMNLIKELCGLDSKNEYVILLRRKYFESLKLPKNWKKVLADFRHYSFSEQIKIPAIIKKENPDITHFPHFNVPLLFHGPFVVTIHDMLMHKSFGLSATTIPAPLYFIKRLGYRAVFDNAVRGSKLIIVPSQAIKGELAEKYKLPPEKIKVTYEGFDSRITSKSGVAMEKPYFVYAGNAYPHKNLENLIKSVKILNTKYNQKVFLAIASARNIFTQRIKKKIADTKAGDFVKLLGFVPDNKLGALFKESVGFIFPSFSEGFGLPGLEALASGTILLASDIKVFREIYADNAFYFDPQDFTSIADAMRKALSTGKSERKERIISAQRFVKRYSWDKMAKATLEVYQNAVCV